MLDLINKFSCFKFHSLYKSKYGRVFEEMVNWAESKSKQAYDLIKNISQDIYEPLQELADSQQHAITGISYEGRKSMKITKDLDEDLLILKSEHYAAKTEMKRSINNYEKFNNENKGEDRDTLFYKDKLFKQMNSKMRVWQEKENLYRQWVKKANENLSYYTDKMQGLVRVYSQMNQEREQIMTDSLNKLVLFETSVDMTLKYDTKMFVKLIEEITQTEEGKEETKISQNKKEEKNDKSKGDETTQNESKESPSKSETQSMMGEEYLDFLARFDQFGEYKFTEMKESENETPVIHDPVKAKYEEEIFTLVQSLIDEGKFSKD